MADQSWNNAPRLMQIAASQQGGSRGAQVWGLTDKYDLVSTYQQTPGGSWSSWSDLGWANAPGSLQQIAACQQNDGRCQLFATDSDQQLWTIWQTSPGGDWSGWSGPGWNGAPLFNQLAACQQGGNRGAQVWGIDDDKLLWTAYQVTPGGAWSEWSKGFGSSNAPEVIDIAAAQRGDDGRVLLWALDPNMWLWTIWQIAPGGAWSAWSGPNWSSPPELLSIAASEQGGTRGPQLWGLDDINGLWTTYQETPGGNWSSWLGPNWLGAKNPFMQIAAAQQNNGCVQLWGIDMNLAVKTAWQTSPGGNWTAWSP